MQHERGYERFPGFLLQPNHFSHLQPLTGAPVPPWPPPVLSKPSPTLQAVVLLGPISSAIKKLVSSMSTSVPTMYRLGASTVLFSRAKAPCTLISKEPQGQLQLLQLAICTTVVLTRMRLPFKAKMVGPCTVMASLAIVHVTPAVSLGQ